MEKRKILHGLTIGVIVLFIVLAIASAATVPSTTTRSNWLPGRYTNEWGDPTNEYFVVYRNDIRGTYSNHSNNNELIVIRKITFSKAEGLKFDIYEKDLDIPITLLSNQGTVIIIVDDKEYRFNARMFDNRTIRIEYSQQLLDTFLLDKNMLFRVSFQSRAANTSPSNYQFTIPASSFSSAYEEISKM